VRDRVADCYLAEQITTAYDRGLAVVGESFNDSDHSIEVCPSDNPITYVECHCAPFQFGESM
jgi:hypothetical protein